MQDDNLAIPHEFVAVTVALAVGLLVGLQRQIAQSSIAGVRTFALIGALGAVCGVLALSWGAWTIVAGLLSVIVLFAIGNIVMLRTGQGDPGMTTEAAGAVVFAVGAMLASGHTQLGAAIGVAIAVLLHAKEWLHRTAQNLGEHDMRAILTFALLTFIILPVVPDTTIGPYGVVNLRNVWLMVVLVSGISLGGYLIWKFFGGRAGIILGGILGGLISSTATTVSYSRRTRHHDAAPAVVVVLTLATAVMYARVLIEIFVVARDSFHVLAPPVVALLVATVLVAGGAYAFTRHERLDMPAQKNPTELRAALVFAAIYAIVLLLVAAAKDKMGAGGLYLVALISGLTDLDAITLSTGRLVAVGQTDASAGWRAIVLASVSNLVFKAGVVAALGSRALLVRTLAAFGAIAAVAVALVLFWPG